MAQCGVPYKDRSLGCHDEWGSHQKSALCNSYDWGTSGTTSGYLNLKSKAGHSVETRHYTYSSSVFPCYFVGRTWPC